MIYLILRKIGWIQNPNLYQKDIALYELTQKHKVDGYKKFKQIIPYSE